LIEATLLAHSLYSPLTTQVYSDKQRDVVDFAVDNNESYCLASGTVRSGKSLAAVLGFTSHILQLRDRYSHLLLGRSVKVLENELLPHFHQVATEWPCYYSYNGGYSILEFGIQQIYLFAGNDDTSQKRLSGLTIHSGLFDEVTLFPKSFFDMGISRLTFDDSKVFMTCNPDSPSHFIKKEWIEDGLFDRYLDFNLNDNPTLGDQAKERLTNSFSGVFKKRYIEGLWVAAEGRIFDKYHFFEDNLDDYIILDTRVGVDYGTTSPSAYVALSRVRKKDSESVNGSPESYVVTKARKSKGVLSDSQIADELLEFCKVTCAGSLVLDPSAASLRIELLNRAERPAVRTGDNSVIPGLRLTSNSLDTGRIKLLESECHDLEEEIEGYIWEGESPRKEDDHACDALRYVVMDMCQSIITDTIHLPEGY